MTIPPSWILGGILAVLVGGYVLHCESAKSTLAESKAIAERQAAENSKQALRDQKAKERSDENYQRNIARLNADVERLRHSSTSFLPTASASTTGSPRACYDRPELDAALRGYREEVAGSRAAIRELIGEGAKAIEGLDESKTWSQGL